jgi:aspartyl-tRNA synthetase
MISGFGKYMQIARCMRDEDPRADRLVEFVQLDVELSFCTQEDVLDVMESCMRHVWRTVLGIELPPFPRLTHQEALAKYGLDKPDLRFGLELGDVSSLFGETEFVVFRSALESGGAVVALRYPGGAALSRRDFDALTETAKQFGAKGMVWIALGSDGPKSSAARFLNDAQIEGVRAALGAETGDALLLFADTKDAAYAVAGKMRNEIGERCGLRDPDAYAFAWVTGFPYLELDEETHKPVPAHHPFTAPAPGDWELIDRAPMQMRAQHYDMVLNGYELGSGSIRIHRAEEQRKIFAMLGLTPDDVEQRFGFFVRALEYGAPPHGGMALGIDRIVMIVCGEENLREITAFPKNQAGRDVMMDAPSPVPEQLLRDLHLSLKRPHVPEPRSPG